MTKRIKVEKLLLPGAVVAGMNPLVIMSLAYMYRSSGEEAPPITVRREGKYYRIVDGRHRYMATVIAGRNRVLANILEE